MNGVHDLGGMHNMGPLVREENEPVFHADWERAMFANAVAVIGAGYCKLDEVRRATEWMPPADYLRASYYETWLYSLTALLREKGFLTREELDTGPLLRGPRAPSVPPLSRDMAVYAMNNPLPVNLDLDIPARFQPGDRVITRNINPVHHTRLPRYARGKGGRIDRDQGIFLLPDTNAHGGPDRPQHVFSVRFAARELWGSEAPAGDAVYIDLFDEYLEPQ
ncbi:MAG: nitrile hydratase subunit beta [Gammaproteobacteria bacterium]|nr:nitrile hydratase subunit beta [Gammaproteobacteria bacterium]